MSDFDQKDARIALAQAVAEAKQKYDQAKAQLDKFDSVFSGTPTTTPSEEGTTPAPKKRGRPAKDRSAEAGGATPAPKPGRPVGSTTAGTRPPLREAMISVIGTGVMGADQVLAALEAKNWLPGGKDPKNYISYTFSKNKDVFERVSHGAYRIASGVLASNKGSKRAAPTAPVSDPTLDTSTLDLTSVEGATPISDEEVEQQLAELGLSKAGAEPNPFASNDA
jgi:hypothetical protein